MRAVLDACVLFPTVLREILLGVAARGLYEPVVSERILGEWVRATAKLGAVAQLEAESEAVRLRAQFPRALSPARPDIEARLYLPDANDLHVLALAIATHADAIITFNAQDFPRHVLADEGLQRHDPDSLLWRIWSDHPDAVAEVVNGVHATAERMAGQPLPLKALLKRAQLPKLARALQA